MRWQWNSILCAYAYSWNRALLIGEAKTTHVTAEIRKYLKLNQHTCMGWKHLRIIQMILKALNLHPTIRKPRQYQFEILSKTISQLMPAETKALNTIPPICIQSTWRLCTPALIVFRKRKAKKEEIIACFRFNAYQWFESQREKESIRWYC